MAQRVIIMGAAGRDFHNFNVYFRDNENYEVVAFTAAQIPDIDDRRYPPVLAGHRYPLGIPIEPEAELSRTIRNASVDVAVLAYSDLSYDQVMTIGSRVLAAGADFLLLGPHHTMLEANCPVIAVCAARTGAGKSQTSRAVAAELRKRSLRTVLVRHPMPYGDLSEQIVQRFANADDLAAQRVTIEEREEYEPIIDAGSVVFAGVDYEAILRESEKEADVIVWDGGNNDFPFIKPNYLITVIDPHRSADTARYYPGGVNVRMADAILVNKVDSASGEQADAARATASRLNPSAVLLDGASPISVEDGERIRGQRVLVVEDGPTTTHGGMRFGAATLAARRFGAAHLVDPRPYAVGSIARTFEDYPNVGPLLPAMGYSPQQIEDLKHTIDRTPCDLVVFGTPIDLRRLITFEAPSVRVRYDLQIIGKPTLEDVVEQFLTRVDQMIRTQHTSVEPVLLSEAPVATG